MNNRINFNFGKKNRSCGSVLRKNGSKKLYVGFNYYGRRIVKSSGLDDNAENQDNLEQWLKRVTRNIDDGSFRFAEAFPGATDEEKSYFARKEGWEYMPKPHQVLMTDYIDYWIKTIAPTFQSEGKRRDYLQTLNDWVIPYVEQKSFYHFSRIDVQKFISQLQWRSGNKAGQPLSRSRVRNILIPFRAIWFDACDEYRWDLSDPFRNIGKYMPKSAKTRREVFRFDEWQRLMAVLDPYFRPVAEVMIMTGMIASEIAGLRKSDIEGNYLMIRNSIVRGQEKNELKTAYRERKVYITETLRARLDEVLARTDGEHVFTMKTGVSFKEGSFRNNYWKPAFMAAGLNYKVPYTTRHTFAAWSLTIGIDPNRLVRLMGHVSKKMIYDVYGDYVEGLEEDHSQIMNYYGQDFLSRKNKRHNLVELRSWRKFGESDHLAAQNSF